MALLTPVYVISGLPGSVAVSRSATQLKPNSTGVNGLRWTMLWTRIRIMCVPENFPVDACSCDIYTLHRPVIRASIMNTMTYTIESVHGVKQTLVLGPSPEPTPQEAAKEQVRELDRERGTRVSSGSHSNR